MRPAATEPVDFIVVPSVVLVVASPAAPVPVGFSVVPSVVLVVASPATTELVDFVVASVALVAVSLVIVESVVANGFPAVPNDVVSPVGLVVVPLIGVDALRLVVAALVLGLMVDISENSCTTLCKLLPSGHLLLLFLVFFKTAFC